MDPTTLLAPPSAIGSPAPYELIVFFKILGFTLHMGPMHLWYAGLPIALWLRGRGDPQGRRFSDRLMSQMPLIIAAGVNLGIVPLLFTQVAYYRAFYPATILIAWPWLAIIPFLTVAYYGVYFYAGGLAESGSRMSRSHRAVGWASAILFLAIGFIFANGFSLLTNLQGWPEIWRATSVAGAPTGLALNTGDSTLWPRWLLMIGIALTTTAAYSIVDCGIFDGASDEEYRCWVSRFALALYTFGAIWFALAGSWYVFGTWSPAIRDHLFSGWRFPIAAATALAPGAVWILLYRNQGSAGATIPRFAWLVGAGQLLLLALNAVSRQIVQNAELLPYLDVTAETVKPEWSPVILFLLLFVAGLGVIAWILRQLVLAEKTTHRDPRPSAPAP